MMLSSSFCGNGEGAVLVSGSRICDTLGVDLRRLQPSRWGRDDHDPKRPAKILLAQLGAVCSGRVVYELNGMLNYLHVGWWLNAHGFTSGVRTRSRAALFEMIAAEIGERQVLYLEFGVHRGDSIRLWAKLLRHPGSRLHGFDSFLGLPHDWSLEGHERGYFSTGGSIPEIDDSRVQFFPGWFEDTLPRQWPEHDALVVMLDEDLYSSPPRSSPSWLKGSCPARTSTSTSSTIGQTSCVPSPSSTTSTTWSSACSVQPSDRSSVLFQRTE